MSNRLAILGCGWLGLPLAQKLIKNDYQINGSTTSDKKKIILSDAGINPFVISLSEDEISGNIKGFLNNASTIIINVPPKSRGAAKENYVKKMKILHTAISKSPIRKVLFVSSISVYGDIEGEVGEETKPRPSTESGQQLLKSEAIFKNDNILNTTILRFGGLIGKERHPINRLSGRKGLPNGHHSINLIHLHDCIKIIQKIVENNWWNEIFNGVYPHHPKKRDYYTLEATKRRLQKPTYGPDGVQKGKIVNSDNLILGKGYQFFNMI